MFLTTDRRNTDDRRTNAWVYCKLTHALKGSGGLKNVLSGRDIPGYSTFQQFANGKALVPLSSEKLP